MEVINTHLETWDDSLYDNYRLNELIGSNIINNIIKNWKEITKKVKIAILEGLDKIYEDMNNKDVQNDLKREIEYVDRIKRKLVLEMKKNLPTNIKRIHNKWKEEITQKAIDRRIE